MTPKQYWKNSDPTEYWAYRRSYELKQEQDFDDMNLGTWLAGLYNMRAVSSAMSDKVQYLDKPIDFKEHQRIENLSPEQRLEEEIKAEEALIHAEFMRVSKILDDNNKKKGGK